MDHRAAARFASVSRYAAGLGERGVYFPEDVLKFPGNGAFTVFVKEKDGLASVVAVRQEKLAVVKKLIVQADSACIVNTAKTYNVTPEEFIRMVQALRSNTPGPEIDPKEVVPIEEAEDDEDTEETEDE